MNLLREHNKSCSYFVLLLLLLFHVVYNNIITTAFSLPIQRLLFHRSQTYFKANVIHANTNINDNNNEEEGNKTKSFKVLKQPNLQRGSNYGENNNSTIPDPKQVAMKLNIKPTKEASTKEWQNAWKLLKRILPILHLFDRCKPPDSSLNLACMWWKALAGNDVSSPVYDNGLSYDILPSGFRILVHKRLCRFYPRLHHANVELRTAFLDSAIQKIMDLDDVNGKKIRLICFGAGYDLRSIKLLERKWIDEAYELDLQQVVDAKAKLIGDKRLLKRRPWLRKIQMPKMIPSDLNDIDTLRQQLNDILSKGNNDDYHTIFVFEGVMIYLNEGIPSSLLKVTSDALRNHNAEGSLCFADRLENIPGGDYELGLKELNNNGWDIQEWCPKPGLARHMGYAKLVALE